ncbi:MAG: hypothetical protein AAF438_19025, partial [Pseudomonadota bacterium]
VLFKRLEKRSRQMGFLTGSIHHQGYRVVHYDPLISGSVTASTLVRKARVLFKDINKDFPCN